VYGIWNLSARRWAQYRDMYHHRTGGPDIVSDPVVCVGTMKLEFVDREQSELWYRQYCETRTEFQPDPLTLERRPFRRGKR
jgi:hypothetical protein